MKVGEDETQYSMRRHAIQRRNPEIPKKVPICRNTCTK